MLQFYKLKNILMFILNLWNLFLIIMLFYCIIFNDYSFFFWQPESGPILEFNKFLDDFFRHILNLDEVYYVEFDFYDFDDEFDIDLNCDEKFYIEFDFYNFDDDVSNINLNCDLIDNNINEENDLDNDNNTDLNNSDKLLYFKIIFVIVNPLFFYYLIISINKINFNIIYYLLSILLLLFNFKTCYRDIYINIYKSNLIKF